MTLIDRIAYADKLERQYRAEKHGLISAKLRPQARPKVWSKDPEEQAAFDRGLQEGLFILEKGEGA